MTTQRIILDLPQVILERAQKAAQALQQPLEDVLSITLAAALPDVEDTPADMQLELTRMTWLSDEDLWVIARSEIAEEEQTQLEKLSQKQGRETLTSQEERTLQHLRQRYGQTTLRKARVYALLSLRGGRPLLESLNSA
jgi:hypothetical protein